MSARDRLILAAVAVVALVGAGWFLILSPQRDEAKQLGDQLASARQQLQQAQSDVAAGSAAKRQYPRDYATVARLGSAVPDDDNVPSLLLQVQHAAKATGIDFRSLEVGTSSSSTPAPPPPPPSGSGGAAATQTATATLPPGAAVGAAGFPTMPFNFEFTGSFFHLSDFVGQLQRFLVVRNRSVSVSGRFMTLDGIALNPAPEGFPKIAASVVATAYLLPATQGLTNGATPDGPGTATPTSGSATPGGPAPASIPSATVTASAK